MSSNYKPSVFRIVRRDVWPVCAAYALVGLSFGAIVAAHHLAWWIAPAMSLAIFAGSAQFAAIGIIASGGGAAAALLAGLVINARLVAYGFRVQDALGERRFARLASAHLITDVNTALILDEQDPTRRRRIFRQAGLWIFGVWNLATIAGWALGDRIADTHRLGLDAVLPAILFALVRTQLDQRLIRYCALAGVVLALASWSFVPPGWPVLMALLGCLPAVFSPCGPTTRGDST